MPTAPTETRRCVWRSVTEDECDYALNAVPPITMRRGFIAGEPYCHTLEGKPVYNCFRYFNGIPHTMLATVEEHAVEPIAVPDIRITGGEEEGDLEFEAVVEVLHRVANDRRLLVVVEDVHWIDPASRDVLTYVARNLRRLPLLLVLTLRTPGESAEVRDLQIGRAHV